jgi:hypothetical protein
MQIRVSVYVFCFILILIPVSGFTQIHSETSIIKKLFRDSSFIGNYTIHDSIKRKTYVEVGVQYIDKLSSGRNSLVFYSQPGVHSYFEGFHSFNSKNIQFKINPILISINPNFKYSQSIHFPKSQSASAWKNYLELLNRYDNSEYARGKKYFKLFGGNTNISLKINHSIIRLSSEQLNWGVAFGDRLVISSNAPGFPHIGYTYNRKFRNNKFAVQADLAFGQVKSHNYEYDDNDIRFNNLPVLERKQSLNRKFSGFDIKLIWERKIQTIIGLNFATLFYSSDRSINLKYKIPVLNYLVSFRDISQSNQVSVSSFYFKTNIPSESISIWAEYGFQNRSFFPHYFLSNDTFPRGYVIGAMKTIRRSSISDFQLFFQLSSLGVGNLNQAKAFKSFYLSKVVNQGYTNFGRLLGSGLGPGGESFYLAGTYRRNKIYSSVYFERFIRNQDFTYATFNLLNNPINDYRRFWIDLTTGFALGRFSDSYELNFNMNFIYSFNYQYQIQGNQNFDYGFDRIGLRSGLSFRKYLH